MFGIFLSIYFLSFALLSYLFYRPYSLSLPALGSFRLFISSIGGVIHHSSRFVIRISEFYIFYFFLPVWWGFVDYVSRHITQVKGSLFFLLLALTGD